MKTLKILAVIGALLVLANSQSKAANPYSLYLNRDSNPIPQLAASFVNVNYNAGNGAFEAVGYTESYTDRLGVQVSSTPDSYTLTATITSAGVLTNGALMIYGDIGAGYNLLLSGDLFTGPGGTAFGYGDGDNQIFQFLFTVTGGDSAIVTNYGGMGITGWVDLYAGFDISKGDTPFTGSWTTSFNSANYNGNMATLDGFAPVPEPSGVLLLLVGGLLGMVARRCCGLPRLGWLRGRMCRVV